MNRYLTVMSEPVREHNGIIDKYLGDADHGVLGAAFYRRPTSMPGWPVWRGSTSSPASQRFDAELPDLIGVRRGLPKVQVRVGIATGEVVVGNIGSEQTRSYTVIGDTVNFASRLEGAGKSLWRARTDQRSDAARCAADAVETREIDTVLVVGKSEPERIFELLGRKGNLSERQRELRATYGTALAAYRRRPGMRPWADSANASRFDPADPPSRVMLARVLHFRERPPADDWDGVWVLEEK